MKFNSIALHVLKLLKFLFVFLKKHNSFVPAICRLNYTRTKH